MADSVETEETSQLIASDKVEGTAVYNRQGERLGTISNFMVNKYTGEAEYAVLQFGGLFGLGSDHYPLPWEILSYDTDKGGYVVNIDKDQLADAPRYRHDDTPEYNDEYGKTVYGYYGMSYPLL
ncbi:MAG: PRC-barrel domain-containing protein [Sphingobium sp.]|jgi:sporulation protein YlmC with PRC-barrel domain|nr:PRC-barrel domain-containing protein [Sphingobium sp.]MCI1271604.1 PRC-barrel domain-containing protein [Sphingobium sp.]MCI1754843.1 PRC-barrel domain-containing protein [Sphingobium sp.]MCI2053656.1 PRC-barrel domain-containing protein [Sphingobium sp.]